MSTATRRVGCQSNGGVAFSFLTVHLDVAPAVWVAFPRASDNEELTVSYLDYHELYPLMGMCRDEARHIQVVLNPDGDSLRWTSTCSSEVD
jgi:hypothetical protein